ncbi:NUDIX domain-containing protein [Glycomyces paridis]|uniref:NUDIX domain-containing protein n=1 Tax=Glycomyces paridis TaxID=2126555 RepID=A0A4S8P753_9ACTN|nr:NUDIX hydrolase [Glycomyces paridis]THV23559.1 NUDIX domain-containing protein [Glycomyces paridis]
MSASEPPRPRTPSDPSAQAPADAAPTGPGTAPPRHPRFDRIAVTGTAACALITDPGGRVLLVKPVSRDEWGFVGGWVDRGETPHEGCAREIKEEIGLDLQVGALLVLDWIPGGRVVADPLTFYVFDGGVVEHPDSIHLRENEIEDFGFFPPDRARERSGEFNRERVGLALEARRTGRTVYQPHRR